MKSATREATKRIGKGMLDKFGGLLDFSAPKYQQNRAYKISHKAGSGLRGDWERLGGDMRRAAARVADGETRTAKK